MDYPGKVITKNQVTPTQTSATGVWTLDDAAAATRNNNWPVAGVPNPISKSLRFNSADSAYLNRTFAGAPLSTTKQTFSVWVKRGLLGGQYIIFGGYDGSAVSSFIIAFETNNTFALNFGGSASNALITTAVYRDPASWYHIVVAFDTTQATAANRVLFYINGVQVTSFGTANYPAQNANIQFALANANNRIGAIFNNTQPFDGYMAEVNFIDGQQLTPSSFGMTDPVTGVWEPLKYSGTYGTNGFYLNFKDATSTTTLGLDYSGNSNTWTTNNFSVTAGAGNDSLTDVPTPWIVYNTTGDVGGVVRGNYATMNPLAVAVTSSISTLTNGNLDVTTAVSGQSATFATISLPSSGKWYWEVTPTGVSAGSYIGIAVFAVGANYFTGGTALFYAQDGTKYVNSANSAYGATYTTNDVIGVAVDVDGGTVTFYKNNSSQGAITYSSGTLTPFLLDGSSSASSSFTANFGQRPFAYTPPSGFLSLCTTNLPASTVLKGSEYMNAVLYTGNGSATNTVTTNFGFTPDLIWNKNRSNSASHALQSSPVSYRYLSSDSTAAEATAQIGSVGDNSYLIGSSNSIWNASSNTYVSWCWKANGAGVTNTAGSITSTVSANTTSGFSIVTYTATGANATVGHGLGVAPSMIIFKGRSYAIDWAVYHASIGAGAKVYLNLTNASASDTTYMNNTAPTSTLFSLGPSSWTNNTAGDTLVAYCFAPISGFSAFGSYTGNGSADGPFVYLGFRPRVIMIKDITVAYNWIMVDTARDTYNGVQYILIPNLSDAEYSGTIIIDILSNGFKYRFAGGSGNTSGDTLVYAAFAENPFKNALAR
jgi:hypothetical protein